MLRTNQYFYPKDNVASSAHLSPSPRTMKEKLSMIDDFGLIAESTETFRPHLNLGKGRNTNSVKLGELWGPKSSQRLLINSKLSDAAQKFKFESWKNERKLNNLKGVSILPHRMDRLLGKSPEIQLTPEFTKTFRVYSPQIQTTRYKDNIVDKRVEIIDEIIKNCNEFKVDSLKMPQGLIAQLNKVEIIKRKLKKNEIAGIKNIMRLLDHKSCE